MHPTDSGSKTKVEGKIKAKPFLKPLVCILWNLSETLSQKGVSNKVQKNIFLESEKICLKIQSEFSGKISQSHKNKDERSGDDDVCKKIIYGEE